MAKKLIAFLVIMLMVSLCCVALAADGLTYYIPGKDISVFVPFDIVCITQETDETNTFFQNEFFDYKTVHDYLINNNMYLYGMSQDYQGEFALLISDCDDQDFNTMSELSLAMYKTDAEKAFSLQGAKNAKGEIYRGPNDKAIRVHYTLTTAEGNQYVAVYVTIRASKLYIFRFISFFTPISTKQENLVQSIFDSIEWGEKKYTTGAKGETDINIYTDYETGLTFMVPSGWSEVKFIAGEESKKVKYRIGTNNVWVLYESGDMWPVYEQSYGSLLKTYGITRADCDNSFLSEEDVSEMLGCTAKDSVTMKTVGGQEYYCVDKTTPYTAGGLSMENHDLVYICMRKGFIYWFQLSGVDTSRFEDQFIRFLKTVEYK